MIRDRLQYIKSYIDSGPDIKGTVMYFILDEVVTALEAAWKERGDAIKERGFLSSQNSELIEDVAAITLERDELRETVKVLSERLAEVTAERYDAQEALRLNGFVQCDIPACNCGSWHTRYGLIERWGEVVELLSNAGHPLCNENGHLARNALRMLITDRDALRTRLRALHCDVTTGTVSQRS